jgi:formylglycine-generating enzyme required for sulfatase activity/CheY-like chemotaxis protein
MATALLIVDRDLAVASALAAELGAPPFAGQFQTSVATTIEEALGAFEAQPVEVLVNDLMVAGTQLAEFARSRFPEIKIIFTSDAPPADSESQTLAAGSLGVLVKPLRAESIVPLLSPAPAPDVPVEPEPVSEPEPPPAPPAPAPAGSVPKVVARVSTPPPAAPAPRVVATPPKAEPPSAGPTVVAKPTPKSAATNAPAPRVVAKVSAPPAGPRVVATPPKAEQPQPGPTVMAKPAPKPAAPNAPAPRVVSPSPKAEPPAPGPTVMAKSPTVAAKPVVKARPPTVAPAPPVRQEPPPAPVEDASPSPASAGNSMIGAVLGPYVIRRALGQGEWGWLFEAVQEQVNRAVAIKVLETALLGDAAKSAQFTSLASRLANLRHNNLVAVYEAGESGGVHYYAREFIEGRSLQEIVESPQKLSPTHTLRVLIGVAQALSYLATNRIPFGPVPGRNILVDTANGEPHLCGFSFLDGSSGETNSSAMTEMPQLAQLLWNALDPAAPQAAPVYALLRRLLVPENPFPSLEHMRMEAEALERSFHTPVVKKARSLSRRRSAVKPIIPGKKPLGQRLQPKHYVLAGVVVVLAVLAVGGWLAYQKMTQLPPADVQTFIHVPAGEFIYQNGVKTTTKEFWVGKYEVTIGQYRKFLAQVKAKGDAAWANPKQPKDSDITSHLPVDWDSIQEAVRSGRPFDGQVITDDCPIFNVNYWDAWAYAKWAGGRLPTEEEWEKAARGTDGRLYPWGNSFDDPKRTNSGKDYDDVNHGRLDGYFQWAPVHAHPGDESPFRVRDMAGNVCEWTDSWSPMKTSPQQKAPVIRGGSWADTDVRVTQRQTAVMAQQGRPDLGFRIVRDSAPPETPAK